MPREVACFIHWNGLTRHCGAKYTSVSSILASAPLVPSINCHYAFNAHAPNLIMIHYWFEVLKTAASELIRLEIDLEARQFSDQLFSYILCFFSYLSKIVQKSVLYNSTQDEMWTRRNIVWSLLNMNIEDFQQYLEPGCPRRQKWEKFSHSETSSSSSLFPLSSSLPPLQPSLPCWHLQHPHQVEHLSRFEPLMNHFCIELGKVKLVSWTLTEQAEQASQNRSPGLDCGGVWLAFHSRGSGSGGDSFNRPVRAYQLKHVHRLDSNINSMKSNTPKTKRNQ